MTTVTVISPVYNEGDSISDFVKRLCQVFETLPYELKIVLVDDGSKDNSWDSLKQIKLDSCTLTGIRLARNFGKEAAIAAGLSVADSEIVVTIDSDLQHPPELIAEMLNHWEKGAEIVVAVKQERQRETFFNRLAAKSFYKIFQWITENNIQGTSDFILLDRKVVEVLRSLPEKLFFYRGVVQWLGYKQEHVLFIPEDRQAGVSGWSFWKKIQLAIDSLTGFSAKPLAIIWGLTAIFSVFALIIGGDALISKAIGRAVSGFSTLILVILITGVAVLSCLCVLSAYIRQIFYEVKNRPRYLISEKVVSDDHDVKKDKAQTK